MTNYEESLMLAEKVVELARIIKDCAIINEKITLSSGIETNYYIDLKRIALTPDGATMLGQCLYGYIRAIYDDLVCVGGPEVGAIPLVQSVLMEGAFNDDYEMGGFFIRKEAKKHGTKSLIDGYLPKGDEPIVVILLEDVTTTGTAIIRSIDILKEKNVKVSHVITVVDRSHGKVSQLLKERNIKFSPLLLIEELINEDMA